MTDVMQMITSVGFPIVACLGMAWYIKYLTDQHKAEMKTVETAVNNNTLVLQKIVDKLDAERSDD